jgi:Tfp pilus assembly protein PilW
MELATKVSGLVIWLMAKASTFILAEHLIKATGKWTNNTGREKRLGLISLTSLVNSAWDKSMDRESSNIQMEQFIKANIKRMTFKE